MRVQLALVAVSLLSKRIATTAAFTPSTRHGWGQVATGLKRSASYSTTAPLFAAGAQGEDTVVARCTRKITEALKPSHLKVSAAHDDPNGSHIAIECVSSMFEGKPLVMRQRLIYKAIWDEMADGGSVHAVDSISAKTPSEV